MPPRNAFGIDAPLLRSAGARAKCLPDAHVPPHLVGEQGWSLDDLLLPAMTLRRSALEHNLALQSQWLAARGVDQAPHAKTHLSPEIVAAQLAAGAWGVTVASVHQARLAVAFGAQRVILAHQLADAASIRALARLRSERPDVTILPLVDSVAGVLLLQRALAPTLPARPLPVLVELGLPGGRTGARSLATLLEVARAVGAAPELTLAGVEGFEGILPVGREPEQLAPVAGFVHALAEAVRELDQNGLFDAVAEIIVTAGGSTFPDVVAAGTLADAGLSRPHRIVLRSGGTVVHDHGELARSAPLAAEAAHPLGALRPALDLWAAVVSVPEPGLALLACGKRDAPYDSELPVLLEVRREGVVIDVDATVERLNDQHAFVRHDGGLAVGDVLRLGPSHPCTAFDKWAVIPVLGDDDRVVGAITTYF